LQNRQSRSAPKFVPTPKSGQIRVRDGAIAGVVLADGKEISVEAVVSGVDPKRTFFQLIDPSQLDPTFANRIKNFRSNGTVAKVNLALAVFLLSRRSMLPRLSRSSLWPHPHRPEIDYSSAPSTLQSTAILEAPYLDVTIPTILDPALAPEGKHVLSAAFNMPL